MPLLNFYSYFFSKQIQIGHFFPQTIAINSDIHVDGLVQVRIRLIKLNRVSALSRQSIHKWVEFPFVRNKIELLQYFSD